MSIQCQTEEQFYDAVYNCTTRGLTFNANADTLTVTLTGGY